MGGQTTTLGVFLKTKHQREGRRGSPKAQRFFQLIQNQTKPSTLQSRPPKEMTDGVPAGFPETCWVGRRINPFISSSVPLSLQVLTPRTNQPPFHPQAPTSGCQCSVCGGAGGFHVLTKNSEGQGCLEISITVLCCAVCLFYCQYGFVCMHACRGAVAVSVRAGRQSQHPSQDMLVAVIN